MSTLNPPDTQPRRGRLTPIPPRMGAGAAVSLAGFLMLAGLVVTGWTPLSGLDHTLVLNAHRDVLANPALLSTAKVITALGDDLAVNLVAVAAGVLLLVRRQVRAAMYLAVVRLVQVGLAESFKMVITRPRPNLPNPVAHSSSFSFPSGHASGTTVVFGALLLLVLVTSGHPRRRTQAWVGGVLVIVWIVAVASSRVLLGVHYPSDVTAGILLGAACCLAGRAILPPSDPAVTGCRTHSPNSGKDLPTS